MKRLEKKSYEKRRCKLKEIPNTTGNLKTITSMSGRCWAHGTADTPYVGTPCNQPRPLSELMGARLWGRGGTIVFC